MARHDQNQGRVWVQDPDPHGSARWGDAAHLAARSYGPHGRHLLGYLPSDDPARGAVPITYGGDRHELIVAPTRGGKGVSGAIPRLLDHPGSVVVLDVKDGELAWITARYRAEVLGQEVRIIDPYDTVCSALGFQPARLNPLRAVDLESDDPFDEAMRIAGGIVVPESHGESHWSGEAEALIAGLILNEAEQGGDLASVRAALNRDYAAFASYIGEMQANSYELIRAAGARIDNKEERELSGVLSTAQRNTHFLESQKLADSLSASDIDLTRIGARCSIYIVLPARRIRAARSWLRILIGQLIHAVTALPERPLEPVLVLLEEMATLERMTIIEQSFGLMAGYGLQLVAVVQDFTQLHDLYRTRWQTFIANAATVQCFGTNDSFTAKYLSELSGQSSTLRLSHQSAEIRTSLFGDPEYHGYGDGLSARPLITPDELMSLHPAVQFIKLAAARPVIAWRPAYFLDALYRRPNGRPLYDLHPQHADRPIPRPVNFTRPGLDLGAVLAPHLKVG